MMHRWYPMCMGMIIGLSGVMGLLNLVSPYNSIALSMLLFVICILGVIVYFKGEVRLAGDKK